MKREEKILICLSGSPSNARVIRAGAKLAEAFRGSISAVFVEPPDFDSSDEGQMGSLTENLHLAKRLGAHVATLYGDNPVWQSLTAVQNGKVFYLEKSLFHNKPNSRFAEAYRVLAGYLYPDLTF